MLTSSAPRTTSPEAPTPQAATLRRRRAAEAALLTPEGKRGRRRPASLEGKDPPLLDAETERRLAAEVQAGSAAALDRLLQAHLRLVRSLARRYEGYGVPSEDLLGEGYLALVEAARRFDPERGARFATYAAWWVRAHLRSHTLDNRRIVGSPSTRAARRIFGRLRATERALTQQLGRTPTRDEVADALGVAPGDVEMVQSSLAARDVALGAREGGRTIDLPDVAGQTPEQRVAQDELRRFQGQAVQRALTRLDAREREIVERRFLDDEPDTLARLGERLGLSRERVRQLERRAQDKLRSALYGSVA
jgi:RNA polymerase sigma-32 factor